MPRIEKGPWSIQSSISDGARSNGLLASDTVVLPWMISSASTDFRRAVHHLISSSISTRISVSSSR
jgi:hypothetical protein